MIAKLASVAFAVFSLVQGAAFAEENDAERLAKIRAVTRQFDKLASRDVSASPDLKQAREQYGNLLREAAAEASQDAALRDHAEIFVLSGGDASLLERWEGSVPKRSLEEKLFEGVMAYGRGNAAKAEAKLLKLDARSFDSMRGGHLALAQALLAARTSPERAFGYFDLAGLLLPGTLVEEAALRQIVVLAARTNNKDRFSDAACNYMSRFPRSAYVGGFESQVIYYITHFEERGGVSILQDMLKAHPRGWGRCLVCFLTAIAEQAALLGKTELAATTALAIMPRVPEGSPEKQRALLYHGSTLIVTNDFARGLEILKSVKPEKLSHKDRELLQASLFLVAKLRETPIEFTQARLESLRPEAPRQNRSFVAGAQVQEAKSALATADAMLGQTK
jgi:chemotaxis protein MotC